MKLETFAEITDLTNQTEIEKATLLTYFLFVETNQADVAFSKVAECFSILHLNIPNLPRLKTKIAKSKSFIRSETNGSVKLHAKTISKIKQEFPSLENASEEIVAGGLLLPKSIYSTAPTYLKKLADQINSCFENNCFDACAVMMRRLLEILLIQSYEKIGYVGEIQDSEGNFKMLDAISKNAKTNRKLGLSRNTKSSLEDFKKVGNFAAHKIMYTTRKGDIEKIASDFRGAIEELLYKSGHIR